MRFDLEKLATPIAYKLLAATVMPRPIAWVTTKDEEGRVNAAPYSFFNAMGSNPPTVAIGILSDPSKGYKDTARIIQSTGEFVINLVPFSLVEQMNVTALNAPEGVEELELAGLTEAPAEHVKPPRIAESPVSFECVNHATVVTGPHQSVVIGRVLAVHVADDYVLNAERGHVDTPALDLVGRSFGSEYIRTRDRFELERPTWDKWAEKKPEAGGD